MPLARRVPAPVRPLAVVLAVVASVAVSATSETVSYGVRALTAITAAGVLLYAARNRNSLRRPRLLIATGLLAGAASGVISAVYVLVVGHPWPADQAPALLELSYAPFALAALIVMPVRRRGGRFGSLADGLMAAGALWYLALQLMSHLFASGEARPNAVTFAFVLVGAFTLATMISVYPRVDPAARPFLRYAGAGLGVILASDTCYAVAVTRGEYDPSGWIAQLYQVGLALLVVAACTGHAGTPEPAHSVGAQSVGAQSVGAQSVGAQSVGAQSVGAQSERVQSGRVRAISEIVLPYAPLALAVAFGMGRYAEGLSYTRADMVPILLIGSAMIARHAASVHDYRALVQALEASEQAARAESLVDPLTELANRRGLLRFMESALIDVAAHPVGVAMIDLNDFKDVNDTHGHETGDRLLRECAERLRAAMPGTAVVARLGGDEFAVCQRQVGEGGHDLAAAIVTAFAEPCTVGRRQFTVRPSVGIVLDERAPGTAKASDGQHLLAHADVAMYQAKADKDLRHAPAVVLTGEARRRAAAMIRLREEISTPDLNQFAVVYQPVVDLRTGVMRGVEALLRWRHPKLGEISPASFIPMAEQVGSMGRLGEHVLSLTAAALGEWARIAPDQRLAGGVNLSPRQLNDAQLPLSVLQALRHNGLQPDQLVLEITEGALMEDLDAAAALVTSLRALGISVAIDDYGTGYSSLRYLRRFDADVLKIDREFVGALVGDTRTELLVRSVIGLAGSLDLQTVAEGIETTDQLRACQELGCELGQGYLFSRPVEAAQISSMLLAGKVFDVQPGAMPALSR